MSHQKTNSSRIIILTILLSVIVFLVDINLPLGVAGGVPYVCVVLIAFWLPGRRYTYIVAIGCTLLTILGFFLSNYRSEPWIAITNCVFAIFAIWVTSILSLYRKRRLLSRRKELEELVQQRTTELQESERRFRTYFEKSTDAFLLVEDDIIIDCNEAGLSLFMTERDELIGKSPIAMSPEFQPDGSNSLVRVEALRNKILTEGNARFEWLNRRMDGSSVWVEITATALQVGERSIVLGVFRDISDRKQAEQDREKLSVQLRHSQKMEAVGQLAGGVAHDFNNLLQVVQGRGEMALDASEPGNEIHDHLNDIMGATKRAATLVSQLLAFTRKQVLKLEALNLNEVIEGLSIMMRGIVGEHIALNVQPDSSLANINADRGQIEQVLMNLCFNARDAMSMGDTLTITTQEKNLDQESCKAFADARPGNYVHLRFTDTGNGMDEEILTRIFEPFFTTKEQGKGTGLGLSSAFGIIQQHNGLIEVSSELNVGTTVDLYFPVYTGVVVEQEPMPKLPLVGGSETILLADDDNGVLNIACKMLEHSGYTVLTARDGEEAINMYNEHTEKIDLALLDIVMPKFSGVDVFDHIQKSRPQMHILFSSGYSIEGIHDNFVLDKDVQLLKKPYRRHELLLKVRQIIDA